MCKNKYQIITLFEHVHYFDDILPKIGLVSVKFKNDEISQYISRHNETQ
jgi:hypothetical protein